MLRIAGIGDNVCDKYVHQGKMYPGGQALNFAVYCKKKGHFAAYVGVFGSDAVGAHVSRTLEVLEVDTTRCRHIPGENGYAVVDLKDGDRVFVTSNKGGVLRENPLVLDSEDLAYLSDFDVIHTSNNSYMDDQLSRLGSLPGLLTYDFSGAWTDEQRAKQVCSHVDVVFLSCSNFGERQIRKILTTMHGWGAEMLIATRGEEGAVLFDGKAFYTHRPQPVKAVDTLGAGDSFAAGFVMRYAEGAAQRRPTPGSPVMEELVMQSLQCGAALSAETCMVYGAFGCAAEIK